MMQDNPLTPKVIVYGGAFDPPHQGHVDCITNALSAFPDSIILVIPANTPAGASGEHKSPSLSFNQRLELCQLAFLKISDRVEVSTLESELPSPNFTIRTLAHLSKIYSPQRLGFLMGQDQLKNFHLWSKPKEILNLASLVVVKRDSPELGFGGVLTSTLTKFAEEMGEGFQWTIAGKWASFPGLGTAIYLIDKPISIASSTLIRDFYLGGQALPEKWLPLLVEQKILNERYYGVKGNQ
jgi:nicotinate (nicotinamide) nucleotide adenylyltransferase